MFAQYMLLKSPHLFYNLRKIGNLLYFVLYDLIIQMSYNFVIFNRYLNYMAAEQTHNIDSINIRRLTMEPVPLFNKNR